MTEIMDDHDSDAMGLLEEQEDIEPESAEQGVEEPEAGDRHSSSWLRVGVGLIALVVIILAIGSSQFGWNPFGGGKSPADPAGIASETAATNNQNSTHLAVGQYGSGEYAQALDTLHSDEGYAAMLENMPDLAASEEAVLESPDSAKAHFQLGTAWARVGLLQPAEQAFKQAIALDDTYIDAYVNLGVVYYQMNRLDEALAQYDKALTVNPDDADVHHNRGAVYVQQALLATPPDQDLIDMGVAEWERALELKPGLAQAYFSLGVVADLRGQKEEAISFFEKFLELDDGSDPQATSSAHAFLDRLKQ